MKKKLLLALMACSFALSTQAARSTRAPEGETMLVSCEGEKTCKGTEVFFRDMINAYKLMSKIPLPNGKEISWGILENTKIRVFKYVQNGEAHNIVTLPQGSCEQYYALAIFYHSIFPSPVGKEYATQKAFEKCPSSWFKSKS